MGTLTRSVALGLVAGGRATAGIATPVGVALRGHSGTGATVARTAVRAAALGEVVVDKLPKIPSRLGFPQLYVRLASGAGGAAALAVVERRPARSVVAAFLAGGAGAWIGAVAGASWRQWAADDGPAWLRPDARAAAIEDAVAFSAAARLVASAR